MGEALPPPMITHSRKESTVMKKGTATNIILTCVLIIGLFLLLYPPFSNYWNQLQQSYVLGSYTEEFSSLSDDECKEIMAAAVEYNKSILDRSNPYALTKEQMSQYGSMLSMNGSQIMGYIEIPKIGVILPVYHGTDESVLQVAVGHLDWTSLPTGGENTHCVVSGHRGLHSARLFTDLDQLHVGDYFQMNVLNEVLTYEVDQIRIVLPSEADDLLIEDGKDLFTLLTCTPYSVNSHRLLVRGHRVENVNQYDSVRIISEAIVIDKLVVAPFVLTPILLLLLVTMLVSTGKKKQ